MSDKNLLERQLLLNFPARPEFSFSNFVVSRSCRLAFDSARQICSGDASPFKTLYLCGNKGLGKTHLLIAIGNQVAESFSDKKALYVSCRDFVGKIKAEDSGTFNQAVQKILNVDFLLLDDVDWISGQTVAQEKLYLIYNSLVEMDKKIVFAGRQNPGHISSTEAFLKSRFNWGMVAELKPIDDGAMAEIIKKLAQDLSLVMPDKVITYLLTRIPRDYHSVQRAVAAINRESYIRKKKVTLPLVKSALNI